MTYFTLITRSFHPDRNFGLGGLGFHGDARGFSSSTRVTSRIFHQVTIDLRASEFVDQICTSDPSSNEVIPRVLELRGHRAVETMVRDEVGDRGVDLPQNEWTKSGDILPKMANDYSQVRKHPRKNISGKITPYREDGDQSVNGRLSYAGKNFAFYGADTDAGHFILGGNISDGGPDTRGGSAKVWERWGGMVPDLDVTHEFSFRINRSSKKIQVSSAISGDGFPNCESFLLDSAKNVIFLGTHIRIGTAATQLPSGRSLPMTRTLLTVDWLPGDLLGPKVHVDLANDYTGNGSPQQIVAAGEMDLSDWNAAHTGRDASGDWLRGIEDHVPLPRQSWRQLKEQIRSAF
ncbi:MULTISPECIES: hypothetical protein [Agrobacterium]|uniref:Uncharacterized protein n=2 Tax=Agrobacterium rosae TaxID=1972867 RepID=A0A1R3TFT1_9HYPH|nr:hypothetical protein [Agrobacterium sp. DSM 25558]SCX09183.1 hypothetical protein DSM25559_0813 [Agrobacterium rosae]SCX19046.1 hypothetical protein DSM25558_2531 [Agrobacterium sp. DSM 25558]